MEVLQLKCGVSVNKIVGGDSGKLIAVEHSDERGATTVSHQVMHGPAARA